MSGGRVGLWRILLAAAVVVLACGTGAARGDETFEDPSGDTLGIASDVTTVAVSNTPDGTITFQITIANFAALPLPPSSRSHLSLHFDLDRNPETGESGEEAQAFFVNLHVNNGAVDFKRWDGSAMVDAPETNMSSGLAGGVLNFTIQRSELLDVTGFDFRVFAVTVVDGVGPGFDFAPDGGYSSYDLVFPPPPPPTLSATRVVATPPHPVAGRRFTVRSVVTRSDTGATVTAGSVRCRASVGTASVRAQGRFRAGRAECAMAIPARAKGKELRGSIVVGAAGATVTTAYRFRVT